MDVRMTFPLYLSKLFFGGLALKDHLIKSICRMFDPGLKVNKSHNVLQFMMCNT